MNHFWELMSSMQTQKSAAVCFQGGLIFSWKHQHPRHVEQGSSAAVMGSCGRRHREQLSPPWEFAALPAGPSSPTLPLLANGSTRARAVIGSAWKKQKLFMTATSHKLGLLRADVREEAWCEQRGQETCFLENSNETNVVNCRWYPFT